MTFSCDSNPANIYFLKEQNKILITKAGKFSFSHYEGLSPNRNGWLFPQEIDISDSEKLTDYITTLLTKDSAPRFVLLTEEQKAALEKTVAEHFPEYSISFDSNEGDRDYIYTIANMAELPGKAFQKKRNHISRFKRTYGQDWEFKFYCGNEHSTGDGKICFCDIHTIYGQWKAAHSQVSEDSSDFLSAEEKSIELAEQNFEKLKLIAGLLYIKNQPAAFIIASFTTAECVNAHFEKCLDEFADNGALSLLNQQFAQKLQEEFPDCKFLNREEDLNIPGLRKSKLSYQPVEFIKKYSGTIEKK